jgi:hypothetical protein
MEYIRKTCPICGNKFVVLKKVEGKAIYCTLKCLSIAQGKAKREKVPCRVSA